MKNKIIIVILILLVLVILGVSEVYQSKSGIDMAFVYTICFIALLRLLIYFYKERR